MPESWPSRLNFNGELVAQCYRSTPVYFSAVLPERAGRTLEIQTTIIRWDSYNSNVNGWKSHLKVTRPLMRNDCNLVHIMNRLDGQFLTFQAVIWSLEIHENCTNWIRLRQEIIQREYLKDFWIFTFGMLISNSRSLILKILEFIGNDIHRWSQGSSRL